MAADDSTHECDYASALRAAQKKLNIALHHAGILKALSDGVLPADLIEEVDCLEIESAALHEALSELHDMLNGSAFVAQSEVRHHG